MRENEYRLEAKNNERTADDDRSRDRESALPCRGVDRNVESVDNSFKVERDLDVEDLHAALAVQRRDEATTTTDLASDEESYGEEDAGLGSPVVFWPDVGYEFLDDFPVSTALFLFCKVGGFGDVVGGRFVVSVVRTGSFGGRVLLRCFRGRFGEGELALLVDLLTVLGDRRCAGWCGRRCVVDNGRRAIRMMTDLRFRRDSPGRGGEECDRGSRRKGAARREAARAWRSANLCKSDETISKGRNASARVLRACAGRASSGGANRELKCTRLDRAQSQRSQHRTPSFREHPSWPRAKTTVGRERGNRSTFEIRECGLLLTNSFASTRTPYWSSLVALEVVGVSLDARTSRINASVAFLVDFPSFPRLTRFSLCRLAINSKMVDLPLEVMQHIISISVPPPDIRNSDRAKYLLPFCHLHSSLLPIAQRLLFRHPVLLSLAAFEGFIQIVGRNAALGGIVQSVRIESNRPASCCIDVSWSFLADSTTRSGRSHQ